jgi:hypothetical protein
VTKLEPEKATATAPLRVLAPNNTVVDWPGLASVGGTKAVDDSSDPAGQFKSYLESLFMYHPDLSVVHGFLLEGQRMRLGSMTGCGYWTSPSVSSTGLDPWIAHVCLVYRSYRNRVDDIILVPELEQLQVYQLDLTIGQEAKRRERITFSPFYTSPPVGRTTSVGLIIKTQPFTEGHPPPLDVNDI